MRYDGYAIDAVDTSPGTLDALVEVLPSVKTIQVVDKLALPTCDLSYYFAGTMRNGEAQFTAVKTFNLTSLDTSRVTSMEGMFANLTTLTYLDLTGFDTSAVCWAQNMFACTSSYESALQFIRVSDTTWAMPAEVEGVSSTYHMFYGCSCLYGAENTTIAKVRSTLGVSEDVATSGTYAVIDKGISSSSPGYLQSSSSGESTSSGGGSVVVGPIVVGGL
jgi:surface protein